ncbi:MAG: PEGA domain-containing protein [Methanoregula sp.]|jgi:hypothetical protein|nr:PEGA domain-containing protein [Methanoregula sp.]
MKLISVLVCVLTLLFLIFPVMAIGGNEGWIEVRCNVDGASVLFDGTHKGVISGGSLTVPVYTTGSPYTTFTVEKPGYYSYSGPLAMPAAGETTTVYATLNPVPVTPTPTQYGSIYVESQPTGAEISFNGDYRGLAPLTISDVYPGSYTITAEKNGYHTFTTTTSVSSGTRSTVYCSLNKLDTTGSLYVISTPSNANIYLDAVYKGRTPMTISNIASGTHILEIDTSGYYDWKSTVDVPVGGTKTLSATLNPMPSSTVGWIYVASSPGGASVTLDGNAVGQTPNSGSLKLNNIASGLHTVSLSLTGYALYTVQTSVSPNTVSEVSAILQHSAPVSTTGGLTVSSTPAGANVFLDNQFIGITPITLDTVTTGTHTVTIRADGYQEYSATTPVNAGATSTVSAALLPATVPTPKSPLPVFLIFSALGIAGIFVMGRKFR